MPALCSIEAAAAVVHIADFCRMKHRGDRPASRAGLSHCDSHAGEADGYLETYLRSAKPKDDALLIL